MRSSGPWLWATALVACVPFLRLGSDLERGFEYLFYQRLVDDAFYYFEISRHIPEFNVGIPCSGFHPLYLFMVAPLHRLWPPEPAVVGSLWLLVSAQAAGALVLYRLLGRLWAAPIAFTGAAVWACSGQLYSVAVTGTEGVLAALFVVLFFARFVRCAAVSVGVVSSSDLASLGALCGLAFLARMDSPIILAPALLWLGVRLVRRGRFRAAGLLWGCAAALPLAWIAYIYSVTGSPFPTSGAALRLSGTLGGPLVPWWRVATQAAALIRDAVAYVAPGGWFLAGAILLVMTVGAVGGVWALEGSGAIGDFRQVVRFSWLVLGGSVLWLMYYALIQGVVQHWYVAQLALLVYGVALPLMLALMHRILPGRLALTVGAAVSVGLAANSLPRAPLYPQEYDKYRAAGVLNELSRRGRLDKKVGAFNTGILNYFAEVDVINLDGVVNPKALEALAKDDMPRYVKDAGIGYLVEHEFGQAVNLHWLRDDERFALTPLIDLTKSYPPYEGHKGTPTLLWKVDVSRYERR